ncbi:MAG: c-type cytochrome [Gemmatimonadota bacterium]
MTTDPQRVAPGSAMPRPLIDSATRELLVRYLSAQPGSGSDTVSGAIGSPTSDAGATLYARFCAACHGTSGRGDGPNARYLPKPPAAHSSAELMSRRSDDALFDTISGGGAIMNRSPRMPAFGGSLNPSEISGLVRHIRNLCRCEGPSWARDRGAR